MTQTYSLFTSGTGGDTPATLVTHTNANGESLRSQFSGTSAPSNPVEGQVFFNTDEKKKYIYVLTSPTEGYWRPDDNVAVTSEVVTARGTTSTLNTRLSVALNDDGSLKESAPLTANKWIAETNAVIYVDSTSFTVDTDVSAIYVEDRAVKLIQDVNDVGYVLSSVYDSGTNSTTVSLKSGTVDSGISAVEYSTLVKENMPYVDTSGLFEESVNVIDSDGTILLSKDFDFHRITLTGNATFTFDFETGKPKGLVLECINFGTKIVSFTGVKFADGGAIEFTASGRDIVTIVNGSDGNIYGFLSGRDVK